VEEFTRQSRVRGARAEPLTPSPSPLRSSGARGVGVEEFSHRRGARGARVEGVTHRSGARGVRGEEFFHRSRVRGGRADECCGIAG
jgi:hypothetical protein